MKTFEVSEILDDLSRVEMQLAKELSDILDFDSLTLKSYSSKSKSDIGLIEYIKKYSNEKPKNKEGIIQFIKDENDKISNYPYIVRKMGFIYGVAQYEAFFSDIVALIFKANYREFLKSSKKVSYEFLLNINDKVSIIENLIENEVKDFGYSGTRTQFSTLQKKYNIGFEEEIGENKWFANFNQVNFNLIEEMFSTRNLILHNRGIVNRTYLNLNPNTELKLGEERVVSGEYLKDSIYLLIVTAGKIITKLEEKLRKQVSS